MASKEQVKSLIKTIKSEYRLKQADISKRLGYEENTLTQLLSKGENLDHAYNGLNLLLEGLKNSTNSNPYMKLLEDNDRFFKNEYATLLASLNKLIDLGMKQEALIKLNLQHTGVVEALQKGEDVDEIQAQINSQIAEIGPYEQRGSDGGN